MTTAIKNPTASVDSKLLGSVHAALGDIASVLVSELKVLVGSLSAKVDVKALEKSVEKLVPSVMERQFVSQFLVNADSARQHRAVLAHLLAEAELKNTVGPAAVVSLEGDAEEVTSEQAAKLLHVSRTHVNTLVAEGKLGTARLTPGGHRRLAKADVLRYKAESKTRQARGLDSMAAASERLGLYEDELAGIPVRASK